MFNLTDIDVLSDEWLTDWRHVGGYCGLYYSVYPQHAFRVPDSEECIRVSRSHRQLGDSGLRFWLSSEWAADWRGRESSFSGYIRGAAFEELTESDFNEIVQKSCFDLIAPLSLPLHEPKGFVGAMMMYSTKTELTVSLLAEYEDEFIHFLWDTTV